MRSLPASLTMALLLGLMGGQPELLPVIVIGAVIGFLVSSTNAPTSKARQSQGEAVKCHKQPENMSSSYAQVAIAHQ